jgi:hypothetical protein
VKAFILFLIALLAGCSPCSSPKTPTPAPVQSPPPTISFSGKTPIEKADPKNFLENNGYYADLDGDGADDFAIMRQGVLSFKKSINGEEVVILKIKGETSGYRIDKYKDEKLPCLFFFDSEGNGYLQRNLGTNDKGLPYFGDIESVE